jgi:hypothetical protein
MSAVESGSSSIATHRNQQDKLQDRKKTRQNSLKLGSDLRKHTASYFTKQIFSTFFALIATKGSSERNFTQSNYNFDNSFFWFHPSQRPSDLRRGSSVALLLGLRVQIPPETRISVLFGVSKDVKAKRRTISTKDTSTDEVQDTREHKKNPAGGMDVCCECCVLTGVTGRSLVERSPTDCGVSLCVIYKPPA